MDVQKLEALLNVKLDDWQVEVVKSQKEALIMNCGRKCGKTTTMAFKIVLEAINNPGWKVCILSRGQRQSSEVFDQVLQWTKTIFPDELPYESKSRLRLENGHTVLSLPTGYTGMTLRTYSFDKIYYDECAYIPDEVYDATTPCLAVHGKQRILASTPAGTSGFFYREWHNADFKRWHKKTTECGRVSKEFLRRERNRMSKVQFAQEYLAEFTDLAEGLFHGKLIYACIKEDIDFKQGIAFVGVDFARFGESKNAIATNVLYEGKSHIKVEVFENKHRMTNIVGRIIALVNENPRIRLIVVDEAGVGGGPTDMLIERFGKRRVIGINNATRVKDETAEGRPSKYIKQDLYSNLVRLMESGKVELDDDIKIIRSLRNMRFKYTKDGHLSIYGPDSDVAEAIVRCVFPLMVGYRTERMVADFMDNRGGEALNVM